MPPHETACRHIPVRAGLFFPLFNRDSKNQRFKDSTAVDGNDCCIHIHAHPAQRTIPKCPPEGCQRHWQVSRNSRQGINKCVHGHFILYARRFCAFRADSVRRPTWIIPWKPQAQPGVETSPRCLNCEAVQPPHCYGRKDALHHVSTVTDACFYLAILARVQKKQTVNNKLFNSYKSCFTHE
jgi:hypothetical protein